MGILTTQDKEKVKRAVPKASNKIIDATVAQLYVAYPDRTKWTATGLMGAVALVDDLVGHTFFLKLVDITGARGVVWDQELYVDFQYHQDRTFFHTFELDDCLAGLLFEDTQDAAHFYKRVNTRHKHASKQTANNKNAVALKDRMAPEQVKHGNRGEFVDVTTGQRSRRARGVLYYDDQPPPEWRLLYAELAAAGISEDMIAENRQFIKDYIAQQGGPLVGLEPPIPRRFGNGAPTRQLSNGASTVTAASGPPVVPPKKTKKAPPPPPPQAAPAASSNIASPSPPPSYTSAPPPISRADSGANSVVDSAPASEDEEPAVPQVEAIESKPRFRLPPMNAPIPQVSHSALPPTSSPQTQQNTGLPQPAAAMSAPPMPPQRTGAQRPGPPPPPRAARVVPPPPPRAPYSAGNTGNTSGSGAPPPPPPRAVGSAPPPPPSRASRPVPMPGANTNASANPMPNAGLLQPAAQHYQPPPPPQRNYAAVNNTGPLEAVSAPPPPPPPPTTFPTQPPTDMSMTTQTPLNTGPPAPPPLPPVSIGEQNASGQSIPPPLPPAANGGPPPPPPPPPPPALGLDSSGGGSQSANAPLPTVDPSRDALLASIRGSGLGMLKKTDKSQLEKPSVLLKEAHGEPVATPASNGPSGGIGGQPETLADALASALNKRKNKVADSDDDDDNEDW